MTEYRYIGQGKAIEFGEFIDPEIDIDFPMKFEPKSYTFNIYGQLTGETFYRLYGLWNVLKTFDKARVKLWDIMQRIRKWQK